MSRTPLIPDPAAAPPRFPWMEKERLRSISWMTDPAHSYEKGGVLYWVSNNAVVPPHVFREAGLICPAIQEKARDEELGRIIRDYREAEKNAPRNPELEAERRSEMRSNFGPGRVIVDIISGRRYHT